MKQRRIPEKNITHGLPTTPADDDRLGWVYRTASSSVGSSLWLFQRGNRRAFGSQPRKPWYRR